MKYIDFDELFKCSTNGSVFLDEKVAKFLFRQSPDVKFLPSVFAQFVSQKSFRFSLSSSSKFSFSHNLVRSGSDQWHFIENKKKGDGGFGAVNGSKFKIIVTYNEEKKRYSAQLVSVNDVVKIQKTDGEPYSEVLQRAKKEATNQRKHGVDVVAVVGTGYKVITVLEDCGISMDNLLPFTPSKDYSFQFRLEVAARVASEMLLLQQKGVVHRDLKPANICYKKRNYSPLYATA